jgi:tRNA threonylcarbamoyladenosine biosynthesis protein TsaE
MSAPLSLSSLEDTAHLAARLAPLLKAGDVIALEGDLGAGKTTFCRALISALLGEEAEVPSPTYTLVQTYEGPNFPIYHFDLYRLEAPAELDELGWEETVDGLALIEWPNKARRRLPAWRLEISLKISGTDRIAHLVPHGEDWQTRMDEFRS